VLETTLSTNAKLVYSIETIPSPLLVSKTAQLRLIVSNPNPSTPVYVQFLAIGFQIGPATDQLTSAVGSIKVGGFDNNL